MVKKKDYEKRNRSRTEKAKILKKLGFPSDSIDRAREFGEKRFDETVRLYKESGGKILPEPYKKKKKSSGSKSKPKPKKEPSPPPLPKSRPNGNLIVFWRDESETVSGREFKHQKQIYKRMKIEDVYIDIFGSATIGTEGYFQQPLGEIGMVHTEIYYTEEQRKAFIRKYRGWTVIYDGQGIMYKDLLSTLGLISHGIYNNAKKERMIQNFILKAMKVNPSNGQRLREDYNQYKDGGF
jgi:hypothetical protein